MHLICSRPPEAHHMDKSREMKIQSFCPWNVKYVIRKIKVGKGLNIFRQNGRKSLFNYEKFKYSAQKASVLESFATQLSFFSNQLTFSGAMRGRWSNSCNEFSREKWGPHEKVWKRSSVKNRFSFSFKPYFSIDKVFVTGSWRKSDSMEFARKSCWHSSLFQKLFQENPFKHFLAINI